MLIHVAETETELGDSEAAHQLTPVAWLDSLGLFRGPTLVAPAGWGTPADIATLAARHGAGAASNNDLDLFEAMRQASFLQKLRTRDPRAIPALAAIEMATIDGARAL